MFLVTLRLVKAAALQTMKGKMQNCKQNKIPSYYHNHRLLDYDHFTFSCFIYNDFVPFRIMMINFYLADCSIHCFTVKICLLTKLPCCLLMILVSVFILH